MIAFILLTSSLLTPTTYLWKEHTLLVGTKMEVALPVNRIAEKAPMMTPKMTCLTRHWPDSLLASCGML